MLRDARNPAGEGLASECPVQRAGVSCVSKNEVWDRLAARMPKRGPLELLGGTLPWGAGAVGADAPTWGASGSASSCPTHQPPERARVRDMDDEDDSVIDAHIQQVNAAFYRAEPAEYFHMRLTSFGAAVGAPEAVHDLLSPPGVTAFGVTMTEDGEPPDAETVARYALIESTNIAHHSIETFFRLFLAHAIGNECPAMEIATSRNPGELKKTLEFKVLASQFEDDLVAELGHTVFGLDHRVPEHRTRIVACVPLVRDLARLYLDESPMYNSIKHGMAAIAGETYFALGDSTMPGSGYTMSGTSVEFLERVAADLNNSTPAFWRSTTRWIDVRERLAAAICATHLIGSLWSLARKRFVGLPADDAPVTVFIPEGHRLRDSRDPTTPNASWSINRFEERPGSRKARDT